MIEARELTKRYGDTTAVHSLSFTIASRTVTGFLGPNGARQVDRARGWRERRLVGRGAGSHACCGVRSGSLSRLAARVAGDAVRRGQVQAERRMKARSSTSSPMERP